VLRWLRTRDIQLNEAEDKTIKQGYNEYTITLMSSGFKDRFNYFV